MKEWVPRVVSEEEMDAIFREAGVYDLWIQDLAKQSSVNKISENGKNIETKEDVRPLTLTG